MLKVAWGGGSCVDLHGATSIFVGPQALKSLVTILDRAKKLHYPRSQVLKSGIGLEKDPSELRELQTDMIRNYEFFQNVVEQSKVNAQL
ncbi:hypothetical protein AVEN_189600-1 [Araneus ventricosus]|uniref:Uncharacterized protein n=1 Tax=Araneus ventricosus TaxID=182803 RepID=A0A4Y2TDQ5_ARAVE|nr:hypothetical protein AVEN_189600-1 [Araneus ventricosus]